MLAEYKSFCQRFRSKNIRWVFHVTSEESANSIREYGKETAASDMCKLSENCREKAVTISYMMICHFANWITMQM